MAFDGITVRCLSHELNEKLKGGRISKIAEPEKDEIQITVKNGENYRLLISANATLPIVYITPENKQGPLTAPTFCMLLRKHLGSAKILDIRQGDTENSLERTIDISAEHTDEMGDLKISHLIVEIMGKHSNIILCDENYKIIDSIKRINSFMSSVREVLPGRDYFLPRTTIKFEPLTITESDFISNVLSKKMPLSKALYTSLTGISPVVAEEICFAAGLDSDSFSEELSTDLKLHVFKTFNRIMDLVRDKEYKPCIVYKDTEPYEYSVITHAMYEDAGLKVKEYDSVSSLLFDFYSEKNLVTAIKQKSADLRKIVNNLIVRETKKLELQEKQLKDTENRDTYRLYGELLTTYGYMAGKGDKSITVTNYYTNEEITIPLDENLSAIECAKKYFDRYSKLKRTYTAVTKNIEETKGVIEYLNSVKLSVELALNEKDLSEIRKELTDLGYIKYNKERDKKEKMNSNKKSGFLHYVSEDGTEFFVGKNNIQNDEITFNIAKPNDWWFHVKGCPGSHVIMRATDDNMPDSAFNNGGALAAYYSSAPRDGKVWVDYVKRKEIKKPKNPVPGLVIYHTNYSLVATADISGLQLVP